METHQIGSTFSNQNELINGNVIQIGNLQARDVNIGMCMSYMSNPPN